MDDLSILLYDYNEEREVNIMVTTEPGKLSNAELREMIAQYVAPERIPGRLRVISDTSDFFRVDYDDILILDSRPYLIRNHEREGRFGIDEQPKFWVKRAIDLYSGKIKIIKLVFHEKFNARVGNIVFECIRSPRKEARILDLVQGHPNFMHGFSARDSAGNIVRVIEYIPGTTLDIFISGLGKNHEDYFHNLFPAILDDYVKLVEAISFLHAHEEKHGDIRRDHIIRDRQGTFRWIDFDFNYWHKVNIFGYDLFGLGNILIFLAGRGDITLYDLKKNNSPLINRLSRDDMNIIFANRLVNLKKIFPYIPDSLNLILLHFSAGANIFYEDTSQFLTDLQEVREKLVTA